MKALLMIAAAALAHSPALAEVLVTADAPRVERVGFADLDLGSQAGVKQLERRVQAAAQKLCVEDGVRPLADKLAERACLEQGLADGLAQVKQAVTARRSGIVLAETNIAIRLGE